MHRNWPQIGSQPHLPELTQQLFVGEVAPLKENLGAALGETLIYILSFIKAPLLLTATLAVPAGSGATSSL